MPDRGESQSVKISVVVPCYNEADGLSEFYERTSAACCQVTNDYEIVFVNDGSSDATWPCILTFAQRDPHVVGINLSRNHGHQLALTAGLTYCAGETIFIIDADLQDPPELLSPMLKLIHSGADVVYGQRRSRAGESLFKKWTAFLFYRLLNAFTDRHIPKDTGDFRLITRRVLDVFNAMPENHRFIRGMISWVGFKQVPFLYDRSARFAGKTKYTFSKMLRFSLDAITSFSIKPLRVALYSAFALSAISCLLLVYSILAYFESRTIRGWTSITAIILFFIAAQFLFLGLIGEYVGRLYLETKNRPLFVVQDVISRQTLARSTDSISS
jgi:dolichol-phosphate mannosyltransferase